jgi:hypothetical protein
LRVGDQGNAVAEAWGQFKESIGKGTSTVGSPYQRIEDTAQAKKT